MRCTVMIVDDEAPLLRSMQRPLEKHFQVVAASSVEAALAAFTTQVSVVLTDFSMPEADGLDLARGLRAKGFRGAIAVLSAVVETDELDAAVQSGLIDLLIPKPWRSAALVDQVKALCAKHSTP
jgi:CheY-like chemotaxis protein